MKRHVNINKNKTNKTANKTAHIIVCGVHSCDAFLRAGRAHQLWCADKRRLRTLLDFAQQQNVAINFATQNELSSMVAGAVHQGIVAEVEPPLSDWQTLLTSPPPLLVALDGVSDPRNLGAVMRAVRAFGGGGVIATNNRNAPLTAVTVRASSGAAAVLPLYRVGNLRRALHQLQDAGYTIIGASEQSSEVVSSEAVSLPCCWVFGGEGGGLRRLTKESCDKVLRIPTIEGAGGCLNVATACAVCLSLSAN